MTVLNEDYNELVSVIILSYKNFEYIQDSIMSVINQEYKNIELIISDDCSPNIDIQKIENFIVTNKKDNIKFFCVTSNSINYGTVKNFNSAISLSKGKYIVPLASDDVFYDRYVLNRIVEFFKNEEHLIITGKRAVYDNTLNNYIEMLPTSAQISYICSNPKKLYKRISVKGNFISGASTIYTREFFQKYGLFDEKYFLVEDYPKYLQALKLGCQIGFLDYPLIKYRSGGVSSSENVNPLFAKDINKVIEDEILKNNKILNLFERRLKEVEVLKYYTLNGEKISTYKKLTYLDIYLYLNIKKIIKKILC